MNGKNIALLLGLLLAGTLAIGCGEQAAETTPAEMPAAEEAAAPVTEEAAAPAAEEHAAEAPAEHAEHAEEAHH